MAIIFRIFVIIMNRFMGNPTKKLPMIERDGWLLPVEKELTARH